LIVGIQCKPEKTACIKVKVVRIPRKGRGMQTIEPRLINPGEGGLLTVVS
jgi:hypothetical protein